MTYTEERRVHTNSESCNIPARKPTSLSSCPFIHRKWRIRLISYSCGVNQKRNSWRISFEENSVVTPQVEYSFLSQKTDDSPHFLLLWIIVLVPLVWGEVSKRGAPSEFLLWDRSSGVSDFIYLTYLMIFFIICHHVYYFEESIFLSVSG